MLWDLKLLHGSQNDCLMEKICSVTNYYGAVPKIVHDNGRIKVKY